MSKANRASRMPDKVKIEFELTGIALQMLRAMDPKMDGKPATPSQAAEAVFKQWLKQNAPV